jgi:hypothetical protein
MAELHRSLQNEVDTQPLIQVAAWALGEFLEAAADVPEVLVRLLAMPQTLPDTQCYLLTALAKLAVRFKDAAAVIRPVLDRFARNNNLEIQQRSGELARVLDKPALCDAILAPVEVEVKVVANPREAPAGDKGLLELGPEIEGPRSAAVAVAVAVAAAVPVAVPVEPQAPPGAVEALRTADYVVYFELQRNATNPRQIAIRSSVFGLGDVPLTQFVVHYGVPQGWGIVAQPPSLSVLEPKGGRPIQQVMMLENRGNSPLAMITQITYMYRTQPIKETGRINPIFG